MLIPNDMQEQLMSGTVAPRWLVWISAKNRNTGVEESAGFSNDIDEFDVEIDGEVRNYVGAGAMLSIGQLQYEAGTDIQYQRIGLSMLAPEVEAAILMYDPRLAPVEIHLALLDLDSGEVINTARAFKGWVEDAPIKESATDGGATSTVELNLVSSARAGTRTVPAKKSPYSQRLRAVNDRGRDYADMAGEVKVKWGEEDDRGYFA